MRSQDQQVFKDVARQLGLWIFVRRTNPASLNFIGRPGYVPKPIDCKAKTADFDVGKSELAGLVADPTLCGEAFKADKLGEARRIWSTFCLEQHVGQAGARYAVVLDQSAPHYGALTLEGNFLHGDYDLYDVVDPKQPQRNLAAVETLAGQPHLRGPNFYKVMNAINSRIGVAMIQHGGEMQYADHGNQPIDAFGPAGETCTIIGTNFAIRGWYRERFAGRPALGSRH